MDKLEVLKRYFGHSELRPGQERVIDALLRGRDALCVMPTGGGKSMCYQIPALMLPGTALVISPLISLMKDQVTALREAGVSAAFVNSSLSGAELSEVYRRAAAGDHKLIYAAPERLSSEGFRSVMSSIRISVAAVDEAHCISQWGQDFRPSYLAIADFIDSLPVRPPVAALTATATDAVRDDIVRLLRMEEPVSVVTGFDRPNLFFDVRQVRRRREKLALLDKLIDERRGRCGIVYCATRSTTEEVCGHLRDRGVSAAFYHAGMEDRERADAQERFQFDRVSVMVATNAFGMGIDKSNVGYVIHFNMPKSIEAYYQEAGRAGRDGAHADCILLYSPQDAVTARYLIRSGGENPELTKEQREAVRRQDMRRLQSIIDYCRTARCLRACILEYFGQPSEERCGACGSCEGEVFERDVTVDAQKVLSCIGRARRHLGYGVGRVMIVNTLVGSRDKKLFELGLDGLSTYGVMKGMSKEYAGDCIDLLEDMGCVTMGEHRELCVTQRAKGILQGTQRVVMRTRAEAPVIAEELVGRKRRGAVSEDSPLFAALKELRTRLAAEQGVPAYIVFSNAALADMAAKQPRSMEELMQVSGVGEIKAARYGEAFLKVIADQLDD